MPENEPTQMVKVFFEPPDDPNQDWHTTVESMFATPIKCTDAPTGSIYRLENSPWYVFGVSYQDDVCAESRHEVYGEGAHGFECDVLYFTKVWSHNGHSTYTVILQKDLTTESLAWEEQWKRLSSLGCTYEGMKSRLLAVDVSPGSDLDAIEHIFEDALTSGLFEYQTQHRFSEDS